ncbi:helix-turn-helix domain-containing protein [Parasphingorhabdus sp.]|uniref:helix-turn-helix domain-containing protein n=1 Tax=Parasphingorhabdus sp. TaxID=2709688 RepID=UPI003BB1EAD8
MSYAATELLEQLRAARLAQNLSQRELGERIGLPQSNIARLESGGTDPSLSKILELARTLDLDLKLVPRKALPTVQGALRANQLGIDSSGSTSRAIHSIRQMKDAFANLDRAQFKLPDTLSKTLDDLERLRFDQTQLRALQDAFKPMERTLDRLRQAGSPPKELSRRFRETNNRLRELRNRIAHGVELDQSHLKPAFSLEDYDDD